MNNQQYNIIKTEEKLRQWGRWCQYIIIQGLDFPSKSIIGQLADSEGEILRSTSPTSVPENEEAELIDALVEELSTISQRQARALCMKYVSDGTTHEKAQRLQLKPRTYFNVLRDAENWIMKRMN